MARPHNTPDVFRAVAHPVRRKMLDMLRAGPRTAAELSEPFHMSQSSISEHLRALRGAGLIAFQHHGASLLYTLVPGQLAQIKRWIGMF